MELELIHYIAIKLYKIEIFESRPQTKEVYEANKRYLKGQLEFWKKVYKRSGDGKHMQKLRSLKNDLNENVSPEVYEILKQDIEAFKRQYIEEIPDKYWNFQSFIEMDSLLNHGDIKSLQEALKYIDTY